MHQPPDEEKRDELWKIFLDVSSADRSFWSERKEYAVAVPDIYMVQRLEFQQRLTFRSSTRPLAYRHWLKQCNPQERHLWYSTSCCSHRRFCVLSLPAILGGIGEYLGRKKGLYMKALGIEGSRPLSHEHPALLH